MHIIIIIIIFTFDYEVHCRILEMKELITKN